MYRRTVLVVEDEPMLRELIAGALSARGFDVVSAGDAPGARRAFVASDPDCVLMDVDLGLGPTGFDLAEELAARGTGATIVFLTNVPDPRFAGRGRDSLPEGSAYLRKSTVHDVDLLVATLDAAMRGDVRDSMRDDLDPYRPFASLTARQFEILRLIALGRTNAQIAEERGISLKSAEDAVARTFAALGLGAEPTGNLRVAAARRYIEASGAPLRDD